MKSSLAILAAASVPLLLSTPSASAGELRFNVPVTDRAQQAEELLNRAAYALDAEISAQARRNGDVRLSNLWVFPTNDVETVYAHYTLTANASSTQHLAILTLRGKQIVSLRDLTAASAESEPPHEAVAAGASDAGNWSAAIGNGHTSNSSHVALTASKGAPAAPHWSASIGAGMAADAVTRDRPKSARASDSMRAGAHWTSKIGTARVSESDAQSIKRRIPS